MDRDYRSCGEINERAEKGRSIMEYLHDYVVLDVETTGLTRDDEIIEAAVLRVRGDAVTERYQQLIKPVQPVSERITKLTGITNEMLENAPYIIDVLPELIDFIGSDIVLGHNVSFDVNFLYDTMVKHGFGTFKNDHMDTLRLSRRLYPDSGGHKLQDMVQRLCIPCTTAHRAMADALTTKACYDAMLRELDARGLTMDKLMGTKPQVIYDDVYYEMRRQLKRAEECARADDYEAAISICDEVKRIGRCIPALYETYAMIHHRRKDYDQEITVIDEAIERMKEQHFPYDGFIEKRERACRMRDKICAAALEKEQQRIAKEQQRIAKEQARQERQREKEEKQAARAEKPIGRAIFQLTADMTVIRRFDSIAEAVRVSGVNSKSIRNTANGVQRSAGGFVWRYEDSMDQE